MNHVPLRPHHLLCIRLFRGYGYSDAFCERMRRILALFRANPGQPVSITFDADELCDACPHHEGGTCTQNDASVRAMDRAVAQALSLYEGLYRYDELTVMLRNAMTRACFDRCCGLCSWSKRGVCSYEALLSTLRGEASP